MMTWNHRVVHCYYPDHDEHTYAVYEVYYDDAGNPEMITEDSVGPFGNTRKELWNDICSMIYAYNLPVLEWDEIGGEEE